MKPESERKGLASKFENLPVLQQLPAGNEAESALGFGVGRKPRNGRRGFDARVEELEVALAESKNNEVVLMATLNRVGVVAREANLKLAALQPRKVPAAEYAAMTPRQRQEIDAENYRWRKVNASTRLESGTRSLVRY